MAGHGLRRGGSIRVIEVSEEAPGVYRVVVEEEGRRRVLRVVARDGVVETPWGAYPLQALRSLRERGASLRRRPGSWLVDVEGGIVRAKLPVRVVELHRRPGEQVKEGEVVMVVETMKMLNEVHAPCSGVIAEARGEDEAVPAGGVLFRVGCG